MIKSFQPYTVNFRQNTALLLCLPVFKTRISRVDHMMIPKKLGSLNQSSTNIQYPHRFDDLKRWLNHATMPKLLYTIDRIRHHNPQNWWHHTFNTAILSHSKNLQSPPMSYYFGCARAYAMLPCLRAWVVSLRGAIWGSPYAKSLRSLTKVRVLLTPNSLWQGRH